MPKIAAAAAVEHTPCETCDVSDFLLSSYFRTDNNGDERDGSRWYDGLLLINDKSFIYDETRDDSAATFNFRFGRFMRPTEAIYYTHCCTKESSVRRPCAFSLYSSPAHDRANDAHKNGHRDTHGGKLGKKSFFKFELLWIFVFIFLARLSFRRFRWSGCYSKLTLERWPCVLPVSRSLSALCSLSLSRSGISPLANCARAINRLLEAGACVCACKYMHKAQQRVIIDEYGAIETHDESNSSCHTCGDRVGTPNKCQGEQMFVFLVSVAYTCDFLSTHTRRSFAHRVASVCAHQPYENDWWMPWKYAMLRARSACVENKYESKNGRLPHAYPHR